MSAVSEQVRTVIFAKAPQPGRVKTRLIPALGAQGAALLAQRMLRYTVQQALAAALGPVELCVTPHPRTPVWRPFRDLAWPLGWQGQGDGDLGDRLALAAARTLAHGASVLLIGTDCPGLTAARLRDAAAQLAAHDAVMVPSHDGGYVLLGLRRFSPQLFQGIAWSTPQVAAQTQERLCQLGWTLARRPPLHDIDEPADLAALPPDWSASSPGRHASIVFEYDHHASLATRVRHP
ncbi:TIGR04282 family arsenosugar biosynthesis glycosyltransferase [Thermomonas sp. S9]|uniref:TIGR04282 family arsenosugar biosynthesis glycosyltransferase n=1 Tax=Thermomonas sp. S9 TaxID=2885203 RepID=UPI00216AFDD3|nr:TIGR04282 family arsenosugar biosynthesis glycosyltransferase [Thermomonas sp. S9]MCR6496521.1 TIGR04282 family arsenosugar biosynthesis glycosyltransferase [Thermomonas sp. S9]